MHKNDLIIRISPFRFLKRLVLIEFFFALAPAILLVLIDILYNVRGSYEGLALANTLSYNFLFILLLTILQIAIVGAVFASWYASNYMVNPQQLRFQGWFMRTPRIIANTPAITHIDIKQGHLGTRFDYGTLKVYSSNTTKAAVVKDIPSPYEHSRLIEELVVPEETAVALPVPASVPELIAGGENQYVEFKSSLMWDYRQQRVNKELYVPVLKNVVAFMNTSGGAVLIGVDDDGKALGLEPDLKAIPKKDTDGFENVFNQAFNKMVGAEFRQFVEVTFPDVAGVIVCLLLIRPSSEPAYLTHKGNETFYIRAGNASQPLLISKATRYIRKRFDES